MNEELKRALEISIEQLAEKIRRIGFKCLRCGDCCRGPDAEVLVFPSEIRRILDYTGRSWFEVVEPPQTGVWDAAGNFHTFGWILRHSDDGCMCYDESSKSCMIYPVRPDICRTYPFYLDGERLCLSECRGLGHYIDENDALRLAQDLKNRLISEVLEGINMRASFSGFSAVDKRCIGICIVHDGDGAHEIPCDSNGNLKRSGSEQSESR